MLKRIFFVFAGLFFIYPVLLASSEAEAKSFKVGFFKLTPHAIPADKTDHNGAAIEYFKLVSKKMGLGDVAFMQIPLARLLLTLEENELDMILLLGKTPERESKLVYPQIPFFKMQPAI